MFFQASELLLLILGGACLWYYCSKHRITHKREILKLAERYIFQASTFALGIYAALFCFAQFIQGILQWFCGVSCQSAYSVVQTWFPESSTALLLVIGLGSLKIINEGFEYINNGDGLPKPGN